MAKNSTWSTAERDARNNAVRADFNAGFIDIYTGAQPAGPDTALTGQTLLATLTFNATAFPVSAAGVLTANAITSGVAAATGTATWFRCYKSDHTTALHDGTVGTAAANMILPTTSIVAAATVSCSAFTITDEPTSSQ